MERGEIIVRLLAEYYAKCARGMTIDEFVGSLDLLIEIYAREHKMHKSEVLGLLETMLQMVGNRKEY